MIRLIKREVYADVSLQRFSNGRVEEIVIVEVKCFMNPKDAVQELYTAIGQYTFYSAALSIRKSRLPLYLAVPYEGYHRLIKQPAVQLALQRAGVKLVVVNLATEEIVEWLT